MAKRRYHQSRRARMHEEEGMERHLRGPVRHASPAVKHHSPTRIEHMKDEFNDEHRHDRDPQAFGRYMYDRENPMDASQATYRKMGGSEYYAGSEPRRRQEMADMGMIHEDHRAIANLPQEVMIKPYGGGANYLPEDLDDTIRGIQRQLDYDGEKKYAHYYPKKV